MLDAELRSVRFRRERETAWRHLELLIEKSDKGRTLEPSDLRALPELYRATLSSLSVARAIALDRALIMYLETLATRAYLVLYAPRVSFFGAARDFFARGFPRSVRAIGALTWIAFAAMAIGTFVGWQLVAIEPGYYLSIVPKAMQAGRTPLMPPEVLRNSLYPSYTDFSDSLAQFAAFLFRNNAMVAIFSFGLGIALGIPTLLLMFYNGTVLGAFLALFARHGLLFDLVAWLSVHGTTELLAIILSGGAGLAIANGILFPKGRESRSTSIARQGGQAAMVAIGAVLMLFIAAFLEGFVRQLVQTPYLRLLIGAAFLAFWTYYFVFVGRSEPNGA